VIFHPAYFLSPGSNGTTNFGKRMCLSYRIAIALHHVGSGMAIIVVGYAIAILGTKRVAFFQ